MSETLNISHVFMPRHQEEAQKEDFSVFRHIIQSRVRIYDVDRQSIVHNAVYLYWLEAARVEYFRGIGLPIDLQTFVTKHRFVVARTEIDYIYPAFFDQEYEVLTRVSNMKNTSFICEQVVRLLDGAIVIKANSVMVHLNAAHHKPEHIPESYRVLIREYEGDNVQIV